MSWPWQFLKTCMFPISIQFQTPCLDVAFETGKSILETRGAACTQLNGFCLEAIQNSSAMYRGTIDNLFFPQFFLFVGRKCLIHCNTCLQAAILHAGVFLLTLFSLKPPVSAGTNFFLEEGGTFSSPARLQVIGLPVSLS
jgi:hypothetical protein